MLILGFDEQDGAALELLRTLTRLQEELGYLDTDTLRELARQQTIPLYRLEGLVSFYPSFRRTAPPKATIAVCRDVVCEMAGCQQGRQRLLERLGNTSDVEVHEVSCLGRCDSAPAAAVNDIPVVPQNLDDMDHLCHCIDDPTLLSTERPARDLREWRCDPYKNSTQYYGTAKKLAETVDEIGSNCIQILNDSKLSGMGGAGFPTGRKWELVALEPALPKYVICNADESEPGTFKDRVILEQLPHLVIEGMLLAGLTIGAHKGIVYVRHEYAREQRVLEVAIGEARQRGILGANAAGSGRAFDIEIFTSPGGYILGEETALLEALEDKRGEPRNKPPFPGTHGLWGKPTLINNVETFALATSIVHHGAPWWHDQGKSESFSGLKFISVSGDVANPGVYEIPIGTSVAELIELAGGMRDGKSLKAFLPGGASSNFLPGSQLQTPLDFGAMERAGSMLGTGAVIAIAEGRDLFALATNLVKFFRNESCGKCVPCRVGSEKAVELLEGVQRRDISADELDILPDLGNTLEQTSICGLGQVALSPILSMMQHFPEDVPD